MTSGAGAAGDTTTVKALTVVTAGTWLSVTCRLKVNVPAVVGVPDNTPAAVKVRPAGRVLRGATAHV
jgi:hypothetical protein